MDEILDRADVVAALIQLQMAQYLELRRFLNAVGLNTAQLDAIADGIDRPTPVRSVNEPNDRFRQEPPWIQNT